MISWVFTQIFSDIHLSSVIIIVATCVGFWCLVVVLTVANATHPWPRPPDCIPCRLLKAVFHVVGSSVFVIINKSLVSGVVPSIFKHAMVQPLMLDQSLNSCFYWNTLEGDF